jgi:hypothetical protein
LQIGPQIAASYGLCQTSYPVQSYRARAVCGNGGIPGPAGPEGELIGPACVQAEATLGPEGKHFTGKFTIDQYDEAGNHLMHLEGNAQWRQDGREYIASNYGSSP